MELLKPLLLIIYLMWNVNSVQANTINMEYFKINRRSQAWPQVKRAFALYPPASTYEVHTIKDRASLWVSFARKDCQHMAVAVSNKNANKVNVLNSFQKATVNRSKFAKTTYNELDCMHVASEPGDYVFEKQAKAPATLFNTEDSETAATLLQLEHSLEVCGFYIVGEPDTVVELTMKHYDVNCESGGLMAFVDGWELNGEYFPSIEDHHRPLDNRVQEFCNNYKQKPHLPNKKFFRSSQNSALLQYRIPAKGSFIVNVRFYKISQPCNILVQDTEALYYLANYGHKRNCSISALFPAVVSVVNLKIGGKSVRQDKPNYDCSLFSDRLEIGGSSGLDSSSMEKSSEICGFSKESGPEQAIFCGVTTVRLLSTGRFQNRATLMIRKAEEHDLDIATLVCAL